MPLIYQGHLAEARRHLETGLALYDPDRHAAHAFAYGQDPLVGGLGFLSWTLVMQGHAAQALAAVERSLRRAESLGHAFSRALALYFSALVKELCGDHAATLGDAARLVALAREHQFPFWLAGGMGLQGRALAAQGRHAEGLALMTQGLETWRATGAGTAGMYFLRNVAEAYRDVGAADKALAVIEEGLAAAERNDYRAGEPELHRLRAEILAEHACTSEEAEEAFRRAMTLAHRHGAFLFARRAADGFARYLRQRGRDAEADQVLTETPLEPEETEGERP